MGSPMDAIIDVKDYITQAKLLNATSIGVSDHGSMASWIEFQDHCKKNGIKPIAGCEFYAHLESDPKSKKSYHVLVIAKNEAGWRNLLKLNHLSNTVGFFTKPRISEKMIFEHKEGLLVGNACISGFVTRHLMNDDEISARIIAEEFRNELGHNYMFELMAHDNITQAKINRQLMQIAKDLDIQVGITLDTHFKDMSYEEAYLLNGRNRRGITQSMIENNPPEDCLLTADFTSKDCECIIDSLLDHGLERKDILAAMDYTVQIDKEIDFEFKDKFELPEISKTPNEDLEKMLGQRLIKKFGGKNLIPNEYKNRLREEYEITKKKGFCQYFLLLIDIIDYCKSQGYMIGPGRGSAGGSLMAYILGITSVDPVSYKLPFERFDSIYRATMLDIDVDISPNDRPKVLEWLKIKYGSDNVVQMITFGEVKAKAAIKEVAKYMEIPFQEVNKICAAIPSLHYDDEGALTDVELTEALLIPEVAKYQRENPRLFELALKLEHSFKSMGCHAGAVILCPKPVYEIAPTAVKKSDGDMLMVGYDKKGCEKVGLVKMDLLALSTLDVIKECINLTGVHTEDIPLDDKKTWEFISDSKSLRGVFQLAENHTKKYLREIRPNNMTELGIINSAMRPGSDYATFARNKKAGVNKPEVDREIVRETLQDTNGALIFQDDLMFLISNLSDMNLGEADLMRRALEKSDKEKVEHYKSKFISTCKYPDDAEKIFHWLEEKVGYAFCIAEDSGVSLADGTKKNIQDVVSGEILLSVDEKTGQIVENKTAGSVKMGDKKVYKVRTKSGKELICTPDHRILTENGYKTLNELVVGDSIKVLK
jgi:DNA polymerase-3 subunit alpha